MFPISRAFLVAAFLAGPAWSQDAQTAVYTPTEADAIMAMRELQSEIGSGKRAFVEEQLGLTADLAAKFWPIYDAHQQALAAFNQRRLENIMAYARHYNASSLDDSSATTIAEDALRLEKDEAAQMERTFRSLQGVVPAIKAAQYLQVENKLRAIVRFEQAAAVPYVR